MGRRANPFLFALMCLIWGMTWLPVKVAGQHVPPILFAAARFVFAAPVMVGVAALNGWVSPLPHWRRILLSGLLVNTGCYSFLFWGVIHAPTGISAIVNMSMIPVFSILFAWIYGQEALTMRKIAAVAIGILGLVLLYSGRVSGGSASDPLQALGLIAVAVASASYCWGAILSRPLMQVFSPIALAGWQSIVGAVTLALLSFLIEPVTPSLVMELLRWPTSAALAFMIIGGTFLAFLIYLRLLRDLGAFRAGLYAFISPVVAVMIGVLALGEPLGWREIGGGAIMFAAAALAVSSRRPAARPDE